MATTVLSPTPPLYDMSSGCMDTALNHAPALDAQKKIWEAQTPQKRLGL
jgi:hypothetical protein